jgi:hypothetical protein
MSLNAGTTLPLNPTQHWHHAATEPDLNASITLPLNLTEHWHRAAIEASEQAGSDAGSLRLRDLVETLSPTSADESPP